MTFALHLVIAGEFKSLMDCSNIQFKYTDRLSEQELDQLIGLFQAAAFWAKDRTREEMGHRRCPQLPDCDGLGWRSHDWLYPGHLRRRISCHRLGCGDFASLSGGGLGRKLVETLVSHPHMSRVERIYLMTTYQQGFYQRIGFEENQSTTMVLYNNTVEMLPALSESESSEVMVG
jgi:hypothetical protein